MGDTAAQACESSLWDLLEPELQRSVIEWALEARKSEARQKYEIIKSMDTAYKWTDFELPPNWNDMTGELQELVRAIRADEQSLLALGAGEDGEMAELQALLAEIINPPMLVFDFSDIDLDELINMPHPAPFGPDDTR